MLTVDDENVWNEYEKMHKDASKYCYKSIPNSNDIVDLCSKDRATGVGAENVDDATDEMSVEEENKSIGGSESLQDDSSKRKVISSIFTSSVKPKKLKAEDTIALAVSEMASSIKQMSREITSKTTTLTIDGVYEELTQISGLDDDVCLEAVEVFANNETKFRILKKNSVEKKYFVLRSMSKNV